MRVLILLLIMCACRQSLAQDTSKVAAIDFNNYVNRPASISINFLDALKPVLGINKFIVRSIDTTKAGSLHYKLTYSDSILMRINFVNSYRDSNIDDIHIYGNVDQMYSLFIKLFGASKSKEKTVDDGYLVAVRKGYIAKMQEVTNNDGIWGIYIQYQK